LAPSGKKVENNLSAITGPNITVTTTAIMATTNQTSPATTSGIAITYVIPFTGVAARVF
jgi:hypothetical protein